MLWLGPEMRLRPSSSLPNPHRVHVTYCKKNMRSQSPRGARSFSASVAIREATDTLPESRGHGLRLTQPKYVAARRTCRDRVRTALDPIASPSSDSAARRREPARGSRYGLGARKTTRNGSYVLYLSYLSGRPKTPTRCRIGHCGKIRRRPSPSYPTSSSRGLGPRARHQSR